MELTVDPTRMGTPAPARRRSAARLAMDEHADTGRWLVTDVPTGDLEAVKRRLYTLANKAGYGLRTESCDTGTGTTTLRMLVRRRKMQEVTI